MKKNFTRIVIFALVAVMLVSCVSCNKNNYGGRKIQEFGDGEYVFKDSVSTMSANWNPHTYQTSDESYPISYVASGLYEFMFNDALHEIDGKDPYHGYVIVPEMAASEPVDVTEKIKKDHPEYGIPESATKGYAYTIDLNKAAKWADGTKINADTYVYSMKELFNPLLKNYRASDYIDGSLSIANAKNYLYQGSNDNMDNGLNNGYTIADLTKGADGQYVSPEGDKMFIGLDIALDWLRGDTLKTYVEKHGEAYFGMTRWNELVALMNDEGLVPLNDDTNAMLAATTATNPAWGESEDDLPNYYVQQHAYAADYSFDNVGIFKSGNYQITIVLAKSLAGFNLLYNLSSNWIVYEPYYEAGKKQIEGTDAWTNEYNTSVENTMSYGPYKMVSFVKDRKSVV